MIQGGPSSPLARANDGTTVSNDAGTTVRRRGVGYSSLEGYLVAAANIVQPTGEKRRESGFIPRVARR